MSEMGKMIGPLPLGAWVAVVGGALAYYAYNRKQADVVPADTTATPTSVDTSGIPTDQQAVGDGTTGGWIYNPPTNTTPQTSQRDWESAAISYLDGQGYDPALVETSVVRYINGQQLGPREVTLIRVAIRGVGSPPNPRQIFTTPPPKTAKKTPPRPRGGGGKNTQPIRYVVRRGDTLHSIAMHFYHNPAETHRIRVANHLSANAKVHAGETLLIPR